MKKLLLIFTMLFVATASMAQQTKMVSAKTDTTGPDKIPSGAKVEDLISKLPLLVNDTNAKSIRFDCRDVVYLVKDTANNKSVQLTPLNKLIKKMVSLDIQEDGRVMQNGKVVTKIKLKVPDTGKNTSLGCDIVESVKDTTIDKLGNKATLNELLKNLGRIEVDKSGVVRRNGQIPTKKTMDSLNRAIDSIVMKKGQIKQPNPKTNKIKTN